MKINKVSKIRWIPYLGKSFINVVEEDGFMYSFETRMFAWLKFEIHYLKHKRVEYEKGNWDLFDKNDEEFEDILEKN